eukprot:6345527-Prymnesium_polylepis.1
MSSITYAPPALRRLLVSRWMDVLIWCSFKWEPSSMIRSKGRPPASVYARSRSAGEAWLPVCKRRPSQEFCLNQ